MIMRVWLLLERSTYAFRAHFYYNRAYVTLSLSVQNRPVSRNLGSAQYSLEKYNDMAQIIGITYG